MRHQLPAAAGLYDPRYEHDSCGTGFIADIEGRRTHATLRQALNALENLAHRGAVSADGKSGDGAGVQTQLPRRLLARHLAREGIRLGPGELGLGMMFVPPEHERVCIDIVDAALEQGGLRRLSWREVPVDAEVLGDKARATLPLVRQVLIGRPHGFDPVAFERRLYLTRRRIERRAEAAGAVGFYMPSFSHRTVVYKGLMVAPQLGRFYPDLADHDYRTAIAVFHQRYSTNTFPTWQLAQPFRLIAHNGEINTLLGNLNWMRARERELRSSVWGDDIEELLPIVQEGASDSAALDNVFELLVISGRSPLHALMMMIPEAHENRRDLEPDVAAFYEYHGGLMEPWDGPAAVVVTDGRFAIAGLDRNGLRPQRYWITANGSIVVGSETGVVAKPTESIVKKGRLGPGQMLAVDTEQHRFLDDATIKREVASARPYRRWLNSHRVRAKRRPLDDPQTPADAGAAADLAAVQRLFGYGREDLNQLLEPMLYESKEPIGSMGDDTPLAVLSAEPQSLFRFFKQRFAQVTNPPIDPLRERLAMSLATATGPWGPLLDEREDFARLIEFPSPVLSPAELAFIENLSATSPAFPCRRISTRYPVEGGARALESALERVCAECERAVDDGCALLVLSDRDGGPETAPAPMLLAIAAAHYHLVETRKRMQASLICDSGEVREDHHFACLIGYGATLVHPWLAYQSVAALAAADPRGTGITGTEALTHYRRAIEKGLLKIMSKMGICPVASYQGAQIFEIIGLDQALVDRYFTGTPCRIGGLKLEHLAFDIARFHASAHHGEEGEEDRLPDRGIYRFRKNGEYHAMNPQVFKHLHKAVRSQSPAAYSTYVAEVEGRPPTSIRDLLRWRRAAAPLALEEVEPAAKIAVRFCTQAMSHGAISSEAHEALAVAMNRLGGKSNSGEGGEDRERFYRFAGERPERGFAAWRPGAGDLANSAIKQVASARFGVTPEYLVAARELEIKMAQGSKPGEGGQIPGHKVSVEIARIRGAVPGVTLISPAPHHDIYSIEDLAQLIYDLVRINPEARIGVKLVSAVGVGTVAAGVVKGYADSIQISGHDGGTGASPLGSIKHAGLPWELGLAETQQVLVLNDLRERVTLRVDGGFKTGRDVVIGALLGADEFGFGTASLVALGCIMARQCHLNTCPVGIATQREELRAKFPGRPEQVISFLLFVAEQVRLILSQIGVPKLEDIIGRVDLLEPSATALPRGVELDLAGLLYDGDPERTRPRHRVWPRNQRPGKDMPLDQQVFEDCRAAVEARRSIKREYPITNRDRSVGARLAGAIARATCDRGLASGSIDLRFLGTAGQSFAAFCNRGMRMTLVGEAQDYVGKGLGGGEVVLLPPPNSGFASHTSVILGNTVLYGATSGALFAAGRAGERLCVRNSGARAVVEGCGDHGCEYMTAGVVVVLGETGRNFGAGMSGGVAYVLDLDGMFQARLNDEMVGLERLTESSDRELLMSLIERHHELTESPRAAWLMEDWDDLGSRFWRVAPHSGVEVAAAPPAVNAELSVLRSA